MIGFVGVLLVFLWLFQVVFLDNFYRAVKTNQIQSTANDIVEKIDSNQLGNYIDEISENSDYCIRITDVDGGSIYENNSNKSICGLLGGNPSEVTREVLTLYTEAIENNGEVLQTSSAQKQRVNFNDKANIDSSLPNYPKLEKFSDFEYMTYGVITQSNNKDYFVLVNSRISVVSEIAQTIREQLMIIIAIVLILALVFAFFISDRISKPIRITNESAKKLAKGKQNVEFEGKGYLEIEELNSTLNYASTELSKVENLRNELIANMSHDLRTPLTMISGYAEVMRDIPNENSPKNVQVIIDECKRLTTLVNDILDLSKISSGTQTLNITKFNITLVIQDIIKRFSTLLKNEQYQIDFEYTQEIMIHADEVKINQVIYNILVNAIHYTGEDHKIKVKQIDTNEGVRIEISDTGEGISEENLPYVWDRYYKLDKVHKRPHVGTGLGLSIVKGILELHHATYGVNSKIKEGTTFYFEIKK